MGHDKLGDNKCRKGSSHNLGVVAWWGCEGGGYRWMGSGDRIWWMGLDDVDVWGNQVTGSDEQDWMSGTRWHGVSGSGVISDCNMIALFISPMHEFLMISHCFFHSLQKPSVSFSFPLYDTFGIPCVCHVFLFSPSPCLPWQDDQGHHTFKESIPLPHHT